jgi:hypothetical protein
LLECSSSTAFQQLRRASFDLLHSNSAKYSGLSGKNKGYLLRCTKKYLWYRYNFNKSLNKNDFFLELTISILSDEVLVLGLDVVFNCTAKL